MILNITVTVDVDEASFVRAHPGVPQDAMVATVELTVARILDYGLTAQDYHAALTGVEMTS